MRKTFDADRRAFVTRSTMAALTATFGGFARAATHFSKEFPGFTPQAVDSFLDAVAAGRFELHSLVLAHHGQIAASGWYAPYRADAPHLLYSLSKSFTSTAVGFAVARGKLRLTDKVVDFFPQQVPAKISEKLAALNVQHLLTMSVGHATDPTPVVTHEHDWVRTFLAQPVEFRPGSVFLYNSAATYMLSAIVQKVADQRVADYLRPRFFAVLGLPEMHWAQCPLGINTGGWGLSATTETLMKFGQFYLQKGRWNGRQLLPSKWIADATRVHIQQPAGQGQDLSQLKLTSDWHQGYGYQFWRCRHNAFRGDGAFGQFCIVLPEQDAVIAMTSRTMDMQGLLNLAWEHLLPGPRDDSNHGDDAAWQQLRVRLAALSLPVPVGSSPAPASTPTPTPAPRLESTYTLAPNSLGLERLSVSSLADTFRIGFDASGRTHSVTSGIGTWRDGETELPGTPPEWTELVGVDPGPRHPTKIAVAGAWKDAQTFEMQWRYYETPHFDTVTLHFTDKRIEVNFLNSLTQMSATLHAETRPVLEGFQSA
jgi:CubicO group peptidase (beta-lactamase class C family)